jgi:hypothetical protein
MRPGQRLPTASVLPDEVTDLAERVVAIDSLGEDHPETIESRGWDPFDPWTDQEARERARRYWPIAAHRVRSWLAEPETSPRCLLLGIPEPDGRTVVRYAWQIDPQGSWEFYRLEAMGHTARQASPGPSTAGLGLVRDKERTSPASPNRLRIRHPSSRCFDDAATVAEIAVKLDL